MQWQTYTRLSVARPLLLMRAQENDRILSCCLGFQDRLHP